MSPRDIRSYPLHVKTDAGDIEFRMMKAADEAAVLEFAQKLLVQMTVDQTGAIAIFEGLGFKAEALLHDHVRDSTGKKHDIVVLAHNVAQVRAQMEAYGLPDAVQH